MILLIIQMKVLREKHKELSQTIASLIGSIRKEKGCRDATFSRVWRMKMSSVFMKNGIPRGILRAT